MNPQIMSLHLPSDNLAEFTKIKIDQTDDIFRQDFDNI